MPDAYRIVITPEALADLTAIAEHIRTSAPHTAARVVESILSGVNSLAFMPSRCRRIGKSRKRGHPVHALLIRPYLVYFRLAEANSTVYILSVRHGKRRQPRRFE